jgi:hypothetical protein
VPPLLAGCIVRLLQNFSFWNSFLRACSKSGILALQTLKFYLAGSKRARKSGFLRYTGRKNPQFERALKNSQFCRLRNPKDCSAEKLQKPVTKQPVLEQAPSLYFFFHNLTYD